MSKDYTRIEKYLDNKMTIKEVNDFEKEIQNDNKLEAKVQLLKDLRELDSADDVDEFLEILKEIRNKKGSEQ